MLALAVSAEATPEILHSLLAEVDAAPQDDWTRMARLTVLLALHAPDLSEGEDDLLESLKAIPDDGRRSWAVSGLALEKVFTGCFEEAEAIASFGLEAAALGSSQYAPRLWFVLAEAALMTGRWDDAQEFLAEMEARLPTTLPTDAGARRELHENRSRLFQARSQILLELGLLDQCRKLARDAIEEAGKSRVASALVAARLLAIDQELMSGDANAAIEQARQGAEDHFLAKWQHVFRLAEGTALVEEVRAALVDKQDPSEAATRARAAFAAAQTGELPQSDRLKLEIGLCDLELCLGPERESEARVHLARARELAGGGGPGAQSRETVRLASLAWRLARGNGPEEVAAAHGELLAAYRQLLEQWASTPLRPGGIGFLHLAWRAQIVSDVIDAELSAAPGPKGIARAFECLLEAQAMGSVARERGLASLEVAEVRSVLLPPRRGLLVLLPARDGSHLFLLDHEAVEHHPIPFHRGDLRDLAGSITSALARPDGKVKAAELARLHDQLLSADVRKHMQGWTEVITVGFDLLCDLPFGLLGAESGKPHGQRFALAALPSVALGVELARRAPPARAAKDLVLVVAAEPPAGLDLEAFEFGPRERERWLGPYAEDRRLLLEGAEATRASLLGAKGLLPGAAVLQFLAHGETLAGPESTAALVLNADGEADYTFESEDAASLGFGGLVILSACASGRGPLRTGDDRQVNLGGAFLEAGARCVVQSRFPVEYQATLALMERFHAGLAAGKSPAESLRAARAASSKGGLVAFQEAAFEVLGLGFKPVPR